MSSISPDRLDSFPEAWKPKAGDKLVGQVVGLDTRETEYGEYPIVTILTEDGRELAFHAYHTVARNELAKLQPGVRETLGVKHFGKAESGSYERYRVLVLSRDATQTKPPNWAAMRTDEPSVEPELPVDREPS